jgi:SHS2 domain-containing protein
LFETFDHTADLGLRISAPDETSLFVEAARALYSILVENPEAIRPEKTLDLTIAGKDVDYLLFDWLTELLYRYEREHFLGATIAVTLTADGLTAQLRGELANPARHVVSHEVKAITYHRLSVTQSADGWQAELIVDI